MAKLVKISDTGIFSSDNLLCNRRVPAFTRYDIEMSSPKPSTIFHSIRTNVNVLRDVKRKGSNTLVVARRGSITLSRSEMVATHRLLMLISSSISLIIRRRHESFVTSTHRFMPELDRCVTLAKRSKRTLSFIPAACADEGIMANIRTMPRAIFRRLRHILHLRCLVDLCYTEAL